MPEQNNYNQSCDYQNVNSQRTYYQPQQPQVNYNNYQPFVEDVYHENDGLATASMICGILSFFLTGLNICGLVLGYIYKKSNKQNFEGQKKAKIGIICSWISTGLILATVLIYVLLLVFVGVSYNSWASM